MLMLWQRLAERAKRLAAAARSALPATRASYVAPKRLPLAQLFTERAKRVVIATQAAADNSRCASVTPEHLLYGLITEKESVATKVLESLAVDTLVLKTELEAHFRPERHRSCRTPLRSAGPQDEAGTRLCLWRGTGNGFQLHRPRAPAPRCYLRDRGRGRQLSRQAGSRHLLGAPGGNGVPERTALKRTAFKPYPGQERPAVPPGDPHVSGLSRGRRMGELHAESRLRDQPPQHDRGKLLPLSGRVGTPKAGRTGR